MRVSGQVIPISPEAAQSLVRLARTEAAAAGQARSHATRSGGTKGGMTLEQRWELAIEAGVEILLDYLRREGKRIA